MDSQTPNSNNGFSPEDIKAALELLKDLKIIMGAVKESVGETADNFKEAGDNVRDFIGKADDLKAVMTKVVSLTKDIEKGFKTKSIGDTIKEFQKLYDINEAMLATGKASATQQAACTKNMRIAVGIMEDLKKGTKDVNSSLKDNVDLLNKSGDALKQMRDTTVQWGQAINGVKLGKLNKAFVGINNLLGRSTGRVGQYARKAQEAHEVKQVREEKIKNNKELFEAKRQTAEKHLFDTGYDVFTNGKVDKEKLRKNQKATEEVANILVGESGGKRDRGWAAKAIGKFGLDSEALAGTKMAAGAGSTLAGTAGMVEGGMAGRIASAAGGPAALALAVADAGLGMAKKAMNKAVEQNKEYEKVLGKGGIFTGDDGGNAFNNIRRNLSAWGLNKTGITRERNLKIAGAMVDSGVNVSELADSDSGRARRGGFGAISDIAFKQAREIGLTDEEGAKQSLKMMQNYHMTFDQTRGFFSTVGKDIKAAGISTTKYLELIDDLTSQFNSMSKSIGEVTTVLRTLGSTGTSTYDVLKENASAFIGVDRPMETNAFLFTQINQKALSDQLKGQSNAANETFKGALDEAIESAFDPEAVEGMRKRIFDGIDTGTTEGLGKAFERFNGLPGQKGTAATTKLQGAWEQADVANSRLGMIGSNPVNAAAMQDILGSNAGLNAFEKAQGLQIVGKMGGFTLGDLLTNRKETLSRNNNSVLIDKAAQSMGFGKPQDIEPWLETMSKGLDVVANTLVKGATTGDAGNDEKQYADFLRIAGIKQTDASAKHQTMGMKAEDLKLALAQHADAQTAQIFTDESNIVAKALKDNHIELPKTQEGKIEDIAAQTRSIDDVLKSISDNIVSKIGIPLDAIARHLFGGKKDTYEDAVVKAQNQIARQNDPNAQQDIALFDLIADRFPKGTKYHVGAVEMTPQEMMAELHKQLDKKNPADRDYAEIDALTSVMQQIVGRTSGGTPWEGEKVAFRDFYNKKGEIDWNKWNNPTASSTATANPVAQNVVNPPATKPKTGEPVKAGDTTIQNITNMTSVASISYLQANLAKNNGSIPYPHQKNRDVPTVPGGG